VRLPNTNVVVLTSALEDESIVAAVRAGAVGYLLKDTSLPDLLQAIKAAVAGQAQISPKAAARLVQKVVAPERSETLSQREAEVLQLLARGSANKEIGSHLGIAEKTGQDPREQHPGQAGGPESHTGRALCGACWPGPTRRLAAQPGGTIMRLQQNRFLQSRVICGTRRDNFGFVLSAPADQPIDRVDERHAEWRQAILDRHRDGRVGGALDDAVALEVAQRDREHALADARYRAADVHEAPGAAVEQVDHEQRPFVADAVEHVAGHPADGDPLLGYFFRTKCA